jgi:prepilin-type N-terminal cleavage/methylation domain-containing protein
MQRAKTGLTLIELLVTIGIISILMSMSLAGIANSRERSRDAKRIADINTIQLALEQHSLGNARYPYPPSSRTSTYCEGKGSGIYNNPCFSEYLAVTPKDPRGTPYDYYRPACLNAVSGQMRSYTASSPCTGPDEVQSASYGLHAQLEGKNKQSANDSSPTNLLSFDVLP